MSKTKTAGKAGDRAVPPFQATPEEVALIEAHRALAPAGRHFMRRALMYAADADESQPTPIRIVFRPESASQCLADLGSLCTLVEVARLAVHALDEGDLPDDHTSDGLSSIFNVLSEARAIYWRSLSDVRTDLFHSIRESQEAA